VPTTEATFQPSLEPHPEITHVVFDFDGTLSWIRHGWPAIMHSVFEGHWAPAVEESPARRKEIFDSIILGLNGRPTIHQMERFAYLLQERKITRVPELLRSEFQEKLDKEIRHRLALIQSRHSPMDEFVVHGGRKLLEWLAHEGLTLIVLSSTIEHRVREEAEALGLTHFFKNRIHGSGEDPSAFSKMDVFQRILQEDGIEGKNLLSFGDGPVEIQCTKTLGGIAIAICSDETENGSGKMDPTKHSQLLNAGADAALPDFRDAPALMKYLLQR
jgi:FMN phosphatase YigB (HAD superfamily)